MLESRVTFFEAMIRLMGWYTVVVHDLPNYSSLVQCTLRGCVSV